MPCFINIETLITKKILYNKTTFLVLCVISSKERLLAYLFFWFTTVLYVCG